MTKAFAKKSGKKRGKPRGKPFTKGNKGKPKGAVAKVPKAFRDWLAGELGTEQLRTLLLRRIRTQPGVMIWALDQAFGKAKQTVDSTGTYDVIARLGEAYKSEHAKLQALALERSRKAQEVAAMELLQLNAEAAEVEGEGEDKNGD